MILIDGVKYACERCIRGHRATKCSHSDQPLVVIKNKGRPSTVCDYCKAMRHDKNSHPEGACSCGTEEKLKKKKEQLKEERRLKKLQKKSVRHIDTFSPSSDNSSIATNNQGNALNNETIHALNCSCYDSGVCNCHKTRKSTNKKITKKKHVSKRRGSESSTDISSRILASQASDHISFSSFMDSASMYSHDSFSNARLMTGSHASNLNQQPNLVSHSNSVSNVYPSINSTPFDNHFSSHTSPDEKLLLLNSNNTDLLKSHSKVASHSFDTVFNVSPSTNMDQLTSFNSFSGNPRKISSNSNIQNLQNDIHSLNEHRKTHWQLHNTHGSNPYRRVDSLKSFSTNNEHSMRNTPDHNTNHGRFFNPSYKENSKRDSHGLLDQVFPAKNNVNVELETFLDSVSNIEPIANDIPSNEPLNQPERGLFDFTGTSSFRRPTISKQGSSEVAQLYNEKQLPLTNFSQPEETIEASNINNAPMKAAESQYFDEFLAQNQDDLKIDEDMLQKSLNILPSINDVDFLIASTDPATELLPNKQSFSENIFDSIQGTTAFDNFNNENIANIQGLSLESNEVEKPQQDEDDNKQAMVLSLRPGTLGLSNLLGNLNKEKL